MPATFHVLQPDDVLLLKALSTLFGTVFSDPATYTARRPGAAYLQRLLAGDSFIAIAALDDGSVIGGLAAYELRKFEQERSEIYLYDLAVAEPYRRQRVATRLIEELRRIARDRGAYVIFVQADTCAEDAAAQALYDKLGVREEVLHFDIDVAGDDVD